MSCKFAKGYEEEIIEGFKVTGMMKRFWASCLENLLEVDRICKKHNIRYFLFYGTLLGAARHKGYIPWDDDLDIAMLREDYERFIEIAKTEISSPFFLSHSEADSCLACCCIHNCYVPQIGEEFLEQFHGCPYPNGLDIFPLDNVPDNKKERYELKELYKVVKYIAQRTDPMFKDNRLPQSYQKYVDHPTDEQIEEVIQGVEEYIGIHIRRSDETYKDLARLANDLAQKYNKKKCGRVGDINNINLEKMDTESIPRRYFEELSELEFEGYNFPVPSDYEKVLEHLYGKEWKIPIRGTAGHDYPCYKRHAEQLRTIFEAYNAIPPVYFYI